MQPLDIAVIGVPVDLGAGRRGVDMGPSAVRYASLRARLEALGHRVADCGNIEVPTLDELPPPASDERLRYLEPIVDMSNRLSRTVSALVREDRMPLIVGGDHTVSIGSVSGVARVAGPIGLIWIDAHGDFNTAASTPSGNIHGMSVAVLTGRGHAALTAVCDGGRAVDPSRVVYIGVRDLDPIERALMREAGVHVFTMHDLDKHGIARVVELALQRAGQGVSGIHVSLDMDSLNPEDAPGVGTPVPGGLTYREAHLAMEMIHLSDRMISMDLVEVNPILDRHNKTATLGVELVCSALGQRIY
jgi:arginase